MDVIEIDGASNNSVDDIRKLRENAKYPPVKGDYKMYIIDEVHMLSTSAFNALLKTLEEPPPQVKFIFATTEIRKVPVTVLSRCQRFDLRRVDAGLLAQEQAGQWLQAAENRLRIAELGWDLHPQGAEAAAQAYNHAAYDFRQAGSMARAILASRAAARAALARGEHAPLYADMENRLGVVLSAAEQARRV